MNRHGHISSDGLVVCGECVADHAMNAALARVSRESYTDAAYEPYEAGEGDDWCSVCDADLVPRTEARATERAFAEFEDEVTGG